MNGLHQGYRFVVVGLVSNGLLYLAYLVLTTLGTGPKVAMTLLYLVGVLQTFAPQRRWTFRHAGRGDEAFVRYLAAYAFCYALQWSILYVLVDRHGFDHALIQGGAIIAIAVTMFLVQKYWVFPAAGANITSGTP
jgi:putative flippase GtrA